MKKTNRRVKKVPVIMQLEALECGAACLAMILAYYGKWIPLEQVRSDCGVSRDGSKASNVIKAARYYGLEAKGYRCEPEVLKSDMTFPCIIHWNFNHFVVLDGFKKDKAIINDPARGIVEVSMEDFDNAFTGIVMQFMPTEDFVPSGKPKSMASYAITQLRGSKTAVIFVLFTTVITSLIGIVNPALTRFFVDWGLGEREVRYYKPLLIIMAVVALVQIVVSWIEAIYSLRINGKMAAVGNTSFMWKVLRLPVDFFSQRMAGDILSRQASYATIASNLVNTFAPLVLDSFMMVFYLIVMVNNNVILAIVGVLSIIADLFVSREISKQRVNITRVMSVDSGKLYGTTVSGIEMIETIKSSGAENGFFKKWAGYQASVNSQQIKNDRMNVTVGMIPSIVSILTDSVITFLGVMYIINGQMTIGSLMLFQSVLGLFQSPANTLISAGQILQEMRTDVERVEDIMNYPTDVNYDKNEVIDEDAKCSKLTGDIEVKDITFGYAKLEEPLIKGFNMKVRKGASVALVGPSGCGKSTLSKLLAGLYHQWDGEILYDGKPIGDIDRTVFTGSLAVVDQDIVLFEDTVANNIRMWDTSIEDFEVILAARDAQIHEDIMNRPGGYEYKINEEGKDFSGGQRQRIEIARVLAQDPTIIILDEATSALDAKTEYDVVKAIRDRGITCIVVAHRLSTIRDCDEIIVLDDGEVVERGTHDELMARGGYYVELISNE